jgi:hypothetical protein
MARSLTPRSFSARPESGVRTNDTGSYTTGNLPRCDPLERARTKYRIKYCDENGLQVKRLWMDEFMIALHDERPAEHEALEALRDE